ncbi:MAG: hypothetical protein E7609_05195 [Ruminococcaceae bacterium]|nr:hypothetical protein [Oscillospiraceae bacterium]
MALRIETGLTAPSGFIEDVFAIDKDTYSPELCGKIENLYKRYDVCPDSFILVYDGDTLAGYLNVFPISDGLYRQLNAPDFFGMRDDDIEPEEMDAWRKDKPNELFIISVAIIPRYRKGEAIKLIGNGFLDFLRKKDAEGYKIGSIAGSAISAGGEKFLQRFGGKFIKKLEDGYKYYLADGESVGGVIENGLIL